MKPESQAKETHYVDLEDIWVAYDHKWVLQSVYFSCGAGEIVGIVSRGGSCSANGSVSAPNTGSLGT